MSSHQLSWSAYLTKGAGELLYHMCDQSKYLEQVSKNAYYTPSTYEQDGFIHATAVATDLLDVANHFYKNDGGKWICLRIEPNLLGESHVIYEAPAPVGNKPTFEPAGDHPKFPHIYGPIRDSAVIGIEDMIRDESGEFLSITGFV